MITNSQYVERLRIAVWNEVFTIAENEPDLDGRTAGHLAETAARAFERAITAVISAADQDLDEQALHGEWQDAVDAWHRQQQETAR